MDNDPIGRQLLIQVLLIGVNAFFASSEMALVSLNTAVLKKRAENGGADGKRAKRLLKIAEEPTGFLSAIQIAITLAGFLGSAFAADSFSDRIVNWLFDGLHVSFISRSAAETLSVIVITLILSYFTLVLGELAPKRIAMHYPDKVADITAPVVAGVKVVLKPVIWFLTKSTNLVARLFGIKPGADDEPVTEEDIRLMLDIGEENGTIQSRAGEMIDNIFELDNSTVRQVMTRMIDVVSVNADADDEAIFGILRESGYSRLPVYGDTPNDVLGILYSKDFFLDRQSGGNTPVKDLLRPAYFVPETVKCDRLFRNMQKGNHQFAVVVDEYGAVSGIVSMEDLLEEIVGNIWDEYDTEDQEKNDRDIEYLGDGTWRVAGQTEIGRLETVIDFDIPDELHQDYETFGGLILSQLSSIPDDGSVRELEIGLDETVLIVTADRIVDHRIESALVRKKVTAAAEDPA